MPDNTQIDAALAYAQKNSPVPTEKLSAEGKELIEDVRDIIGTMRDMVKEKNYDEIFQETVYQSYGADLSHAKQGGVAPISKDGAKADGDEALKNLRVLATLFITNGEVRKLVSDFGVIGRDMFATAAEKAANAARPDQEKLSQVDRPAEKNTWIGPDGQRMGTDQTPELGMTAADGSKIRYNPKDAPNQAQYIGQDGQTTTAGEARQQYQDTKQQASQNLHQAGQQGAQAAQQQHQQGGSVRDMAGAAGQNVQQGQGHSQGGQQAQHHAAAVDQHRDPNAPLSTQAGQLRDGALEHMDSDPQAQNARGKVQNRLANVRDKIPEEHRARMADGFNTTRDIVEDAFPEERRDQFIYRLKKVLFEVQQHKDYNEAMTWLLDALERYEGYGEHMAQKGQNAAQDASSNRQVSTGVNNFFALLERFANGRSLEPVRYACDQLYTDSKNDPELRQWWNAASDYVHRVLLEPGYVMEDDSTEEGKNLYNHGKAFFTQKYKNHWDHLWNELSAWIKAFNQDPLNHRFGEDWKRLTKDLLFDGDGNLTFKPKLWSDIRSVILPSLIRNIGYLPIPRAEYTDDKLDLVIENLILSGPNLIPNLMTLENHNYFKFSPYDTIKDYNHHRFRVGMSQIQADIRDVRFAFKKKSGFPKIADRGIADVVIARNGITVDIEVETVENRRDSVFRVKSVTTKIDELSFKIRESKHDLLYKFIKGAATGAIKKAISAAVEKGIRTGLEFVDEQLAEVRNTVNAAKQSDETTRKQALQEMYKRKKADAEQAKKEKVDDKKGEFRIVTDRDQQMLPEMTQDSSKSIAKRVWKTEDAARSGPGWHSPAFSLRDKHHPATTGAHHPQVQQQQRGVGGAGVAATQPGVVPQQQYAQGVPQQRAGAGAGVPVAAGVAGAGVGAGVAGHGHQQGIPQAQTFPQQGVPQQGIAQQGVPQQQYAAGQQGIPQQQQQQYIQPQQQGQGVLPGQHQQGQPGLAQQAQQAISGQHGQHGQAGVAGLPGQHQAGVAGLPGQHQQGQGQHGIVQETIASVTGQNPNVPGQNVQHTQIERTERY